MEKSLQTVIENVHRLAATDPNGGGVEDNVQSLFNSVNTLSEDDPIIDPVGNSLIEQVDLMRSLMSSAIAKHQKVMEILNGVREAVELLELPANEPMRPRVASVVQKIAGVFAAVDTVADLEGKSLDEIENAVHKLYGNQALNSTFYTARRGKGFTTDSNQ